MKNSTKILIGLSLAGVTIFGLWWAKKKGFIGQPQNRIHYQPQKPRPMFHGGGGLTGFNPISATKTADPNIAQVVGDVYG